MSVAGSVALVIIGYLVGVACATSVVLPVVYGAPRALSWAFRRFVRWRAPVLYLLPPLVWVLVGGVIATLFPTQVGYLVDSNAFGLGVLAALAQTATGFFTKSTRKAASMDFLEFVDPYFTQLGRATFPGSTRSRPPSQAAGARLEEFFRETLPVYTVGALEGFPSKSYTDFLDAESNGRIEVLAKYDPEALSVLTTGAQRALHYLLASGAFLVLGADVVLAVVLRDPWLFLGAPLALLGFFLSVPGFMRTLGLWLNRGLIALLLYLWYEGARTPPLLVASYLVANFAAHAARHHCRLVFLNGIARSELVLVWLFLRGTVVPVPKSRQ